jgi:hypothetical protein
MSPLACASLALGQCPGPVLAHCGTMQPSATIAAATSVDSSSSFDDGLRARE